MSKWLTIIKEKLRKADPIPLNPLFRTLTVGNKNIIIRPETPKQDMMSKEDSTYYNKMYLLPHGKHQLMQDFAHFVYIDPIIDGRYFWHENEIDRRAMEKHDGAYNAYIKKVAISLTKDPIQIVNPSSDEDKDPTPSRNRQKWWHKNRMDKMARKAFRRIRRDGYVVYYPIDKNKWKDYNTRGPYYIFSDKELMETEWDEYGHPITWNVRMALKNGAGALLNTDPKWGRQDFFERTIHIDEVVYYDPNDSQEFIPEPQGSEFWDNLVDYHYISEAVKSFDQRLGNGFMMVTVPYELWANDTAMDKLEAKIKNVRTEEGIIVPSGSKAGSNPPEFNWMGMQGVQVDFVGHLNNIKDDIAGGMRFPKRWLYGDSEGAMESSGKDKLQVHIRLSEIFSEYTDFIKAVLKFHNQIQDYDDVEILPGFKLDLSDQEKAEMDLVKTQNIAAKIWLTVNEQRQLDDPTLEDKEGGDELFAEQDNDADNQKDIDTNKGNDVSQGMSKSETKTDSWVEMEKLLHTMGVKKMGPVLDVSPTTISKLRASLKQINTPHYKCDSLALEDSVAISDNIYRISNAALVIPQTKYYNQYNANCIRSPKAIKEAFNDPRTPKEFRIGVKTDDTHPSKVPLEITSADAVGTVQLKNIGTDGIIYGDITYDLNLADKILGDDNWMREYTESQKKLPTSISLYSKDIPHGADVMEENLDIRSFVFTRKPRNEVAGGI